MAQLLGMVLICASTLPMVYSQSTNSPKRNSIDRSVRVNHVLFDEPQRGPLVEEFSFLIKDFKLRESTNLNISISYRYVGNLANSEYPDFVLLAKDVEGFLTNYPNKTDYWEVVNKNLTALLLKKYPTIMSITSELKVDPTPGEPYIRWSRVTRDRAMASRKRR